jgi:hypothetical protein
MAENDPGKPGNQDPAAAAGTPPAVPAAFVMDDAFLTTLPDDLKAEPSIQTFKGKGAADILKSYVNAQKMVGGDKVVVPAGKLDTEENWNALFEKIGRPKSAEDYKFEAVQPPEGMPIAPEFEKSVKALAHRMGLVPKQAAALHKEIMGWIGNTYKSHKEGTQKTAEEAETALKTEWGNKYDANLGLAVKVLDTYGGKAEEVKAFKDKFGNDLVAVRILANIGNLIGEGNFIKGQAPAFLSTPAEAQGKAMDIMTNTQNPLHEAYHSKQHIRHDEAVEEVQRLFIIAKGNEPVDKR